MNKKRYNAFNQIHKGLRGMLYDTALRIQTTDFGKAEAAEIVNQVQLVVDLFDDHAHHEDSFVLPLVAQHNPELVNSFEEDHVLDHKLSDDLRDICKAWAGATNIEDKTMIGQQLFYAFNEFIAFNLYHMNREEQELLLVLWQHNTDEALLAMQQAIIQSIKPETLMIESKWMMRNLNDREIIYWLGNIKKGAPAEVFDVYLRLAQDTLPQNRWNTVSDALKMEQVAA